jgi:hypothetical protein
MPEQMEEVAVAVESKIRLVLGPLDKVTMEVRAAIKVAVAVAAEPVVLVGQEICMSQTAVRAALEQTRKQIGLLPHQLV